MNFTEKVEEKTSIQEGITYMSFSVFSKLQFRGKLGNIEDIVVIADEFD